MDIAKQDGIERFKVRLSLGDLFRLFLGRELENTTGGHRVAIRLGRWPTDVFRGLSAKEKRAIFVRRVK